MFNCIEESEYFTNLDNYNFFLFLNYYIDYYYIELIHIFNTTVEFTNNIEFNKDKIAKLLLTIFLFYH